MASSCIAKVKTDVVILSVPESWDQWYKDTNASLPSQMWKYFDPDSDTALTEPVEPVMLVDEPLLDGNKPPQVQNARITRNQRYEDVYFKLFQVFRGNKKKLDRYHEVDAKLRERIQSTVALQKKATLPTIYPVRQWLTVGETQWRYRSKPSDSILNSSIENWWETRISTGHQAASLSG